MDLETWLTELANIFGGGYDDEGNLIVDTGDGFTNSYAAQEVLQFFKSRFSPKEAADVLRFGGMQ